MALVFDQDARTALMEGVNAVADAEKGTLGPRGRSVALHQKAAQRGAKYSDPVAPDAHVLITNDGATIAESIVLEDPLKNMGAQLVKEAAEKANEAAGDGTTTTIVLVQALLQKAFRLIAAGAQPLSLRTGMQKAAQAALKRLESLARPCTGVHNLARIAALSCRDEQLGALIGESVAQAGVEGVVKVDESQTFETTLALRQGLTLERGMLTPAMATDEMRGVAELEDPYILLCNKEFTNPQDLIPALLIAAEHDRPCLVICDGVKDGALALILENKREGDMDIVAIQAPEYGEGRIWAMEDLAIATGGVYVTDALGMNVRDVTEEMLGTARHVTVEARQTVINGGGGDPKRIAAREAELRHQIETTDYAFNRERYQTRLARLAAGIAVVNVGGRTETERWDRRKRAEDAVAATQAAVAEGIVPGGGVALLWIRDAVEEVVAELAGDERFGAQILTEGLAVPLRQILVNAGIEPGPVLVELRNAGDDFGYDVVASKCVSMDEAGIVDPKKVVRVALECAISCASTVLTTEAVVTAKFDPEEQPPVPE